RRFLCKSSHPPPCHWPFLVRKSGSAAPVVARRFHWRSLELTKPPMPSPSMEQPPTDGQPLIAVRNLVKVYQTPAGDVTVLKGLDLDVRRGEFVAIIGKSGSGKS